MSVQFLSSTRLKVVFRNDFPSQPSGGPAGGVDQTARDAAATNAGAITALDGRVTTLEGRTTGVDQTARDAAAAAAQTAAANAQATAANATAIAQESRDRAAGDDALNARLDGIPTGRELSVVPTGSPARTITLPENYRTYDVIFLNWPDGGTDAEVSLSIDLLPAAGNRTYRSGGGGRVTWNPTARTFTLTGVSGSDEFRTAELYQAGVASPTTGTGTLADGSVTTAKLRDGAVTTPKLADDAVTAAKLADDAVTSRKIAADAITSGLIADDAVDSEHIARDAIQSEHIGADQVGRSEIAGEAVSLQELDPDVLRRIDAKANAADIPRKATNTDVDVNKTPAAEAAANNDRFLTPFTGYRLARRVTGERVTTAEKTAGTATGPRTMSPKDVVDIIDEHAPAGTGDVTTDQFNAEVAAREAGDKAIRGDALKNTDMRVEPPIVPTVAALVRNYVLHLDSIVGVPDDAAKVVVSAGVLDVGGVHLAWDNAWVRTRREISLTRFNQQALTGLLNSRALKQTDRSLPVQVGFYPSTFPNNGQQEPASALAYFVTSILIGDALDLPTDFTGHEKEKLDRYDENPLANGASFQQPFTLIQPYPKAATDNTQFTGNDIPRGQFQSRTESRSGGNVDVVKIALRDEDLGSFDYWLADPVAAVTFEQADGGGTLTVTPTIVNRPDPTHPWLLQMVFPADSGLPALGNEQYVIRGAPKFVADSGADLSDVEDFARKDRDVDVPADKTLNPLFDPDNVPFQFGASTADPTASGSKAQVTARPRYGTALSDTAVTTEVNAIPDATLTLTQEQVTHAGALIIVDCELANLASDRFTGVELILRTPTGTVVSRHSLPSSATSSNPNLRFPLTGLVAGGDLQFALGATVRGREQQVIVTLSNLRYQRDGAAPAESYVRDWAKQEVAKEAAVHEARDARIEMELVSGDQTLPAPTGVGARRSPRWDAAGAAHQRQAAADAFVIPASGYAQFHMTGEAAWASPILHVNEWKVPQTMRLYSDTLGAIQLFSDGTRVFLQNRNAAGNGAYPNQSLLLLGRGFQWFTWPEEPPAAGVVSLLTEDQVNALVMQQINALMGRLPTKDQLELFIRRNPVAVFGLTDAANIAWNVNDGLLAAVTLAGNRTIANPTNVRTGDVLVVELIQDATGGRTVTWGSNFRWPDDEAPTLSTDPNSRDIATFFALSPTVLVGGPIVPDHE